ncbi:uncharacterized protein K441DRAFT_667335 [Cenococcum geophilum 1.58]|uniref:uncharacterized protein n=1 Tax=Cenococcum geophilum 1.58 TaxID=794803 RepID=UPI00358ED55E|nr:hypothetical protein K441DRAFT_667335 [Cenococcum geophilum 1.58]
MHKLQTIEFFPEDDEDKDWNTAEYEAYVQYHFQSFYEVETGVYDRMKDRRASTYCANSITRIPLLTIFFARTD